MNLGRSGWENCCREPVVWWCKCGTVSVMWNVVLKTFLTYGRETWFMTETDEVSFEVPTTG